MCRRAGIQTADFSKCKQTADTFLQHNFKDHVTFMGAMKNHGLISIDFKRSIMPHDSVDAPIPMEGPCQVRILTSYCMKTTI